MTSDDEIHTPVLLDRTLELLAPALGGQDAVLVDATLGMGGHAEAALRRFPDATVVGIDRDLDAIRIAEQRLAPFGDRVRIAHAVYDELPSVVQRLGLFNVSAVLFDLGVSSLQLDLDERGFSYSRDSPLDMRMDASTGPTAATVLAEYSEEQLKRIFYEYGDEKLAPRYASRIVRERQMQPLLTSGQLVELIVAATPAAAQRSGHPAKRVFQALRIEVNDELAILGRAMPAAIDSLAARGRIVVLSYQSLEDRLVKRALRSASTSTAPRGLPIELPEHRAELRLLVRGAEQASPEEVGVNPRAASVRLRAAEKAGAVA